MSEIALVISLVMAGVFVGYLAITGIFSIMHWNFK